MLGWWLLMKNIAQPRGTQSDDQSVGCPTGPADLKAGVCRQLEKYKPAAETAELTCQAVAMVGTAPSLIAFTYASVSPASTGPWSTKEP